MALPKAVRDQVKYADQIMDDLARQQRGEGEKPPEEDTPPEAAPEKETAPKAPEAAAPEAPEAPELPEAPPKDDFEQKYKVLQGKYNAEVPRLQRQVNDLTGKISQLEGLLSQLQKPSEASPTQQAVKRLVTDEEIEEYGPEFMDIVGRRAQEIAGQELSKLTNKITQLESKLQNVGQTVEQTGREKVYAKLNNEVEDWAKINDSQEFFDWLDQRDVLSGIQRGRLLHEAFRNNDAQRVVSFFQQYKREHAAVQPQPSPPKSGDSSGSGTEKLVAPGRARSPTKTVGAQEEKRVYTMAEINQFFADKRRKVGIFKTDPQRAAAIEADILKASAEGRVASGQPHFANAAY